MGMTGTHMHTRGIFPKVLGTWWEEGTRLSGMGKQGETGARLTFEGGSLLHV